MPTLAQLAEQFRAQRPAPPAPYTYPQMEYKTYPDMGFTIRDVGSNKGQLTPIPVRKLKGTVLVTTYRYRIVFGFRFKWPRGRPPEMSLFFSINPVKPGKPAVSNGQREFDYYPGYAFAVEIEGLKTDGEAARFQKFDGFDMEVESLEYRAGDDKSAFGHARPGMAKHGRIKLTKGYIKDTQLWDWCNETGQGKLTRRNVTVHVLPETRDKAKPLVSYNFIGCWPVKWSGLRLDGSSANAIVEELELVVDYGELAKK
jgi:phage tail-like protein